MRVRLTASARLDRLDITDYIAAERPRAAQRMDQLFSDAAAFLADFRHEADRARSQRRESCLPMKLIVWSTKLKTPGADPSSAAQRSSVAPLRE